MAVSSELQNLLEAISSSDVVESRIELLTKLGESDFFEKSDMASLIASLAMFWDDFTCLDLSQCMLNKTILGLAAKYFESDKSGCLGNFLSLGIKANIWCAKHLKMTLMSTGESQEEEHYNLFFQLLLDLFRYSASCFSTLARSPVSDDKELTDIVEKYISEQLNLTKESISEIKRIHTFGSEVLKVAQLVLDAVMQLCKVYTDAVNMDLVNGGEEKDEATFSEANTAKHVINITKCTIEQFCDLGVLAANDGGNLVTVLNSSWKGVVALLQLGKGCLATKLNVANIILSLISLANGSLKCTAENWSFVTEKVTEAEAKRMFLPVKFFLINAVRISSQYPCQSFSVYKDLTLCVLMISTFRFFLSEEELLKVAGEILVELLEPLSFHLLNSILNSGQLKEEDKFCVLDWLFDDYDHYFTGDQIYNLMISEMHVIFSQNSENMQDAKILLLGRVALFLNLLKNAPDLEEDVRLGMSRKLGWLLRVLVEEEVYSSSLSLELTISCGSGKTQQLTFQPMLFSILHALKTFMVVISSSEAWKEMEIFLLENIFHPHFLCREIVMELWCFLVRHAEEGLISEIIHKLFSFLTFVASSESALDPTSALRNVARPLCVLLSYVSQSTVDQVYNSVVGDDSPQLPDITFIALLMEGFPLDSLSDKLKSTAVKRIIFELLQYMESFGEASCRAYDTDVFGASVFALSASLQSLQGNTSDIDKNILGFLVKVIHSYKNTLENSVKGHLCKVLSETLGIISNMKHLYASDEMEEVILELQNLFVSGPAVTDAELLECKPNLASFMAGLGHIELDESDSSTKSSAVLELYHILLREQHWAFAHLAISAFGYFAARTSCNQLWKFVPQNAALSFDLELANDANEERFLAELKVFLEKETALLTVASTSDQLRLLVKEGQVLKESAQKHQTFDTGDVKYENMEIDVENRYSKQRSLCDDIGDEMVEIDIETQSKKRRKLPDEIRQGVELMQSGLKSIGDGICELRRNNFDAAEIYDKLYNHYSQLELVVNQFVTPDND